MRKRNRRNFLISSENLINFLTSVDSVCSLAVAIVVASVVLSSFLITDEEVVIISVNVIVDDEGDCVIRSEVLKSVAALVLAIVVDDLSISVEIDASRVL